MAIDCTDRDWRTDTLTMPSVHIVPFTGPNLTDADFDRGGVFGLETWIQGELNEAQNEGWSHLLFTHGEVAPVADEVTRGELVRSEVLHLISWDVVWRKKCRIYKDALLAAIRPPLNDVEREYFDELAYRVGRAREYARSKSG